MVHLSIRKQLFILMAAVAAPLGALLGYTIYSNARQEVSEAKSNAHMLAVVAASDVTRVLAANRDMLKQMAMRPIIREVNGKHCDPVLWDFHALFPKSANMTVVDLNGIAICSAVPQPGGKPVNVSKAEWFKRSLVEDGLVVSKPFFGPITGRWVTVLTYPIHDDMGRKTGFLGLPLDLALYEPNLSGAPLIPGTTVGVQTADGVLVWRNVDPEKWVGKDVSNLEVARKLLVMKSGVTEGVGLDGKPRFYAVTPVAGVDWLVFVGIPADAVNAHVREALIRNALLGGAILLGLIGFALLVARKIENPILALAATARRVRNGNNDVRAIPEGAPEIAAVAEEFNEMLDVRIRTEIALTRSEASLSETLRIARLGYWEFEVASGEFVFNDQYYSLHRTSAEEMGGYRMALADFCSRLISPEDAPQFSARLLEAVETQDAGHFSETEERIRCVDGEVRWVHVRFRVEMDGQGRPARLIGASQDVSERKKAEMELLALKEALEIRVQERTSQLEAANKELEAFSYSVSHDLRAPLRAIDGFSRILQEEYGGKFDDEGKHMLNVVRENALRMGQLIDDILHFSRSGRVEMMQGRIDMETLAREVLDELLHNAPQPALQVEIGRLPQATGDRAMLKQVYANLFSNALKFSHNRETPRVEVGSRIEGSETVYYVKDNGAGFDMQYADRLFGVFQRLHSTSEFEGTGIGLAIVKRIVTRHGGRVWAEGATGEGATFYFTLPRGRGD